MNIQDDPGAWAMQKFGVGQPVPRTEDPTLLRGEGRYTDDLNLPGQAYAVDGAVEPRPWHDQGHRHRRRRARCRACSRSIPAPISRPPAIGRLKCVPPFKNRDGTPMKTPPRPALATDKVRFVGDPVACVVAETAIAGQGRGRSGRCSTSSRCPPSPTPSEALKPGAPQLYRRRARQRRARLPLRRRREGQGGLRQGRPCHAARARSTTASSSTPMEPRAAIAAYDRGERALHVPCRLPGRVRPARPARRDILNVPPAKVRVLTGNVGGSFGMKAQAYPEYVPPAPRRARCSAGRSNGPTSAPTSFLSDSHGRDHEMRRRARARRGRPLPRPAAHRLRQCRRLSRRGGAAAADASMRSRTWSASIARR